MRRAEVLPADIGRRLATLGDALARVPGVVFGYLFGGATRELTPMSDIDVAVYLDEGVDLVEARLAVIGTVTSHLATDAVDVVVLNDAPTSLVGRVLLGRRVIYDRDPFRRHRFESLGLRQFFDFRVFEHRLLAQRFGRG